MKFDIMEYKMMASTSTGIIQEQILKLELAINERLKAKEFEIEIPKILAVLKAKGYDLYRLNLDNDIYRHHETWGMNYRNTGINGLEIDFRKPGTSTVSWIITNKSSY